MLALVGELLGNLDMKKQRRRVELLRRSRLFVFACLLQIRTIAGTIQRDLALLTTALRANSPVNGGAEALFLANLADRAAQIVFSCLTLCHSVRSECAGMRTRAQREKSGPEAALVSVNFLTGMFGPFRNHTQQIHL
jgi:hypothetical protein